MAWRVFDFQRKNGNDFVKEPKNPRPPEVKSIGHNAFHEQVGDNGEDIEDLLAASAAILSASDSKVLLELSEQHRGLALSQAEAIQLSRRIGRGQLNIPLNPEFEGKLMFVRPQGAPFELGDLAINIIGPFKEDLEKLREDWNDWLEMNQHAFEVSAPGAGRRRKLGH